jgi:hypothetical protein
VWQEGIGSLLLLAAAHQTGFLATLSATIQGVASSLLSSGLPRNLAVVERLVLTLLFLPVAGLARTWDLRTYTGTLLALVTGRGCAYSYAYVEQFLSRSATNVLFLGPPGTGKTHLSLALTVKALAAGYSALFTTLTHLAEALESAPYPSLMRQRLRRYTTPSVLVIDEVGYTKLSPAQAHHFFELVTARYEHGSIRLASNTSFSDWGNLLGDEVLATALLDRLLHHAEVISIAGPSYRMKDRRVRLIRKTGH